MIEHIENKNILKRHLKELVLIEPRFKIILEKSGEIPLRRREGGFEGLSAIISAQLLSVASANAIHNRLKTLLGDLTAKNYLTKSKEEIRACGFSNSKYNTMLFIAEAELAGELNYEELAILPIEAAIKNLTKIKGIGIWSAQIYLLFCVGHGDIFPAGDLVLQKMLAHIFKLDKRPNEKQSNELIAHLSPYRGAASRLLWRYFAVLNNKEGIKI